MAVTNLIADLRSYHLCRSSFSTTVTELQACNCGTEKFEDHISICCDG